MSYHSRLDADKDSNREGPHYNMWGYLNEVAGQETAREAQASRACQHKFKNWGMRVSYCDYCGVKAVQEGREWRVVL